MLVACGKQAGTSTAASGGAATTSAASSDVIRIGFTTDMSGVYADADGKAGAEAIQMAIDDFGGEVLGKKIELVSIDHQNKADIALSKAREWVDQQNVTVLISGTNSAVALATAKLAAEKQIPFFSVGAATARLTNEDCTPYTIHYGFDTVSLARVTGSALLDQGLKSWYFLTTDYAFGHSLEKDTTAVVEAGGGKVLGSVRAPLGASDFSSFLLQAKQSNAQVLALANAGADFTNSVRAALDFGINKDMKVAALVAYINDIHALGIDRAQGLLLTEPWYWNQNAETTAFSKRFEEKIKRPPSFVQAGDYSAATAYLNAVKATGTTDGTKIMEYLKSNPINDMYVKDGKIREDGRLMRPMYLVQVKTPAESTSPWDLYKTLKEVPGEDAFTPVAESKCSLLKKS
ncbi:ABC transporter substrate-binding protein [Brachymonas sp. G13]|uniref:ABC transporter substrate-binding protein n=1 Tax=Brachymonas wangyanguii TaxID=3130163 RepID=UPI00386B7F78